MEIEVVHHAACQLGEGVLWDEQTQQLWWIDILQGKLHQLDQNSGEHAEFSVGQHIGTVGLRENGGLIVALANGLAFFDPVAARMTLINDPESHLPNNRFNDGKPGPDGAFWVGSMAYDAAEGAGSLYRLGAGEKTAVRVVSDITISNGLAWTANERHMYYIDSPPRHIYRFDFDAQTGLIKNQQLAFSTPTELGYPDGMTIDEEDMLWIAHYGGGAVCRWNPKNGELLEKIALPASKITCCTFGGAQRDRLFITSAHNSLTDEALKAEPLAGATFAVKTAVTGRPAYRYHG